MGTHLANGDLDNHLNTPSFHVAQKLNISRFLHETSPGSTILARKFTKYISWVCIDRGRNLGRRHSDRGYCRIGKLDASDIYPRVVNAKEVFMSQKGEEFIFPVADGTAKLQRRKGPRNLRNHSKAGTNRKEWNSQWRASRRIGRVSTDRIHRRR